MGAASDSLEADIACIRFERTPATLISTKGTHCNVWRSAGYLYKAGQRQAIDFVIKQHREPCRLREVQMLNAHYQLLKRDCGPMIPDTVFIATRINRHNSVIALAQTVKPWFNLANPANDSEAVPLLRKMPRTLDQLEVFTERARHWRQTQSRVIDLYGIDNLVLDTDHNVRYLDSFYVFFYEDMLDMLSPDDPLHDKVRLSVRRLEYLEYLLHEANGRRM